MTILDLARLRRLACEKRWFPSSRGQASLSTVPGPSFELERSLTAALLTTTLAAEPGSQTAREPAPQASDFESSIRGIDAPPPQLELPSEPVEIPMILIEGDPVIEVRMQGKGPYRFLIDTGASGHGVISRTLAQTLRLRRVGVQMLGDSAGVNRRPGHVYEVPEVAIGGAILRGLWLTALTKGKKPPWQRKGLDGILGFELFGGMLVTLDYPGRVLRLERGELPADAPNVLAFTMPNGVPRIPVRLGTLAIEADIDSGSMSGFVLPADLADQIPWATQPSVVGKIRTAFNEAEIRSGRSKEPLRIGDAELLLPVVEITPYLQDRRSNLGTRVLRSFRITFDADNTRVRFDGPADPHGSSSTDAR